MDDTATPPALTDLAAVDLADLDTLDDTVLTRMLARVAGRAGAPAGADVAAFSSATS